MMIAVAAAAALLWIGVQTSRIMALGKEYKKRSGRYFLANLAYDDPTIDRPDDQGTPEEARQRAHWRAMTVYNNKLSDKYRNAAARPWFPVEPDPPPPKP
jgi:hypothetical protein